MSFDEKVKWSNAEHGEHEGHALTAYDGGHVINCERCGFSHIVPLPSKADQRKFYAEEFYQKERTSYIEASTEDSQWLALGFTDRLNIAEKALPADSQKRVLDIGCGPGDFLVAAKDNGWTVTGVEPSPIAASHAASRGVHVINDFFTSELAATMDKYDFIHLSEVLEHIENPIETLVIAMTLLADGGVLAISVPNDFNPLQQAVVKGRSDAPWWVVPDHHVNYFNFESLEKIVTAQGLVCFERLTNFPMEMFLLMGDDYTADPKLGKICHNKRKSFDLTLAENDAEARINLYKALAQAGLGRLAIIFAQK